MIKIKLYYALFLVIQFSADIIAQTEKDFSSTYYNTLALFFVFIVLLIFLAFLYFGMGEGKPSEKKIRTVWLRIKQMLNASAPIEKEQDILLDHNYDGIRELDNRIPPWFTYLFYITILFAVYYMIDYHVLKTGTLQDEEYAMEVKAADALRAELVRSGALINEETVTLLTDENSLNSGKGIYKSNCIACHREDGGGLIGPNLTDDFWIHGGDLKAVFKIIKYGVPAKGMISWQTQLNPKQIQEVTSFIFTLSGTNPQNAKAPEGIKYAPEDTSKTVAFK